MVHFDAHINQNDPEIFRQLIRVEALSQSIMNIPLPPASREHFNHLNILRAVRGTTGIEGSDLTEEEVGEALSGEPEAIRHGSRVREANEARNARDAMEWIVERVTEDPDLPLSEAIVKQIHRIVTEGIDYKLNVPGRYRTDERNAGGFTPPPAEDLQRLMDEFFEWFRDQEPRSWHPVLRALTAHFYIVTIHPFGDGNGRTSRAVESMLLYQAGMNVLGFYSLANFYYRQREDYIAQLDAARFEHNGDLTAFARFALSGLVAELEVLQADVQEIVRWMMFKDYAREQLDNDESLRAKTRRRRLRLLTTIGKDRLDLGLMRNRRAAAAFLYEGLSAQTMQRDIDYLVAKGLVVLDPDGASAEANLAVMSPFVAPHI